MTHPGALAVIAAGLLAFPAFADVPLLELRATAGVMKLDAADLVQVTPGGALNTPSVTAALAPRAAATFGDLTEATVGKLLEIFVCGRPMSRPQVLGALRGGRVIVMTRDQPTADWALATLRRGTCDPEKDIPLG